MTQSSYVKTPEWNILMGAISRCHNPRVKDYTNYGGRGIIVHQAWRENPALFIEHMGPRPSKDYQIERINNDGNYEPGNVRWATRAEQSRNKRRVYPILHNGQILTTKEYCREIGLSYHTYQHRLGRGWNREEALTLEDKRIGNQNWRKRKNAEAINDAA